MRRSSHAQPENNVRLLISCPDRKGLISAVSSFISMHDGNILSADQCVGPAEAGEEGRKESRFFMRIEIEGDGFGIGREKFPGAFASTRRWYSSLLKPSSDVLSVRLRGSRHLSPGGDANPPGDRSRVARC